MPNDGCHPIIDDKRLSSTKRKIEMKLRSKEWLSSEWIDCDQWFGEKKTLMHNYRLFLPTGFLSDSLSMLFLLLFVFVFFFCFCFIFWLLLFLYLRCCYTLCVNADFFSFSQKKNSSRCWFFCVIFDNQGVLVLSPMAKPIGRSMLSAHRDLCLNTIYVCLLSLLLLFFTWEKFSSNGRACKGNGEN